MSTYETNRGKICYAEGCEKPARSKGLCDVHYARLKTKGSLKRTRNEDNRDKACKAAECNEKARTKGFCNYHYARLWRNGDLERKQTKYGAPKRFVEERVPLMTPDECELDWPYAVSGGRPQLSKKATVRYAYQLLHGKEPKGQLNHIRSCNNGSCWNPHHVYDGTHQQNVEDVAATTGWIGNNRKLTDDEVRAIRQDNRPHSSIAKSYGIVKSSITRIKNGLYYNHVQ